MVEPVVLVAGGRARCAVEVAAEPAPGEETAARELVRYLGSWAAPPSTCTAASRAAPRCESWSARALGRRPTACRWTRWDDGFVLDAAPDLPLRERLHPLQGPPGPAEDLAVRQAPQRVFSEAG